LIGEGNHSLLTKKEEWPIVETHRMRPSATISRGQNSSARSQRTWEIFDCDCGREVAWSWRLPSGFRRRDPHSRIFSFLDPMP
jgi:hypothetical protein